MTCFRSLYSPIFVPHSFVYLNVRKNKEIFFWSKKTIGYNLISDFIWRLKISALFCNELKTIIDLDNWSNKMGFFTHFERYAMILIEIDLLRIWCCLQHFIERSVSLNSRWVFEIYLNVNLNYLLNVNSIAMLTAQNCRCEIIMKFYDCFPWRHKTYFSIENPLIFFHLATAAAGCCCYSYCNLWRGCKNNQIMCP